MQKTTRRTATPLVLGRLPQAHRTPKMKQELNSNVPDVIASP
jgi:hypothetical protein